MRKSDVKNLEKYYYQWMNKYKDDADRRLALLEDALELIREDTKMTLQSAELIKAIKKELADADS